MARQKPESQAHRSDVMVYHVRTQRFTIEYNLQTNRIGPGGIQTKRVTFPPGLSFVPADRWPHVTKEHGWKSAERQQLVQRVAGHGDGLAQDWASTPAHRLVTMIRETVMAKDLERLRDLEASLERPRHDVAEAIDEQLHMMQTRVERARRAVPIGAALRV